MGVFQLWVKASFPINAFKIQNFISHKEKAVVMQRKLRFDVMASTTSENALLASRTIIMFVVDP